MQVFVKRERLHALTVGETETVASLKRLLEEREGVNGRQLRLWTRSGRFLQDDQILCHVVDEGAQIDAEVPLLGGKKLSLSRVGKVRAQTPRVEKIDRVKKKKTGRAKKRRQYNRRFMNSISGNGRSPNANQEYL